MKRSSIYLKFVLFLLLSMGMGACSDDDDSQAGGGEQEISGGEQEIPESGTYALDDLVAEKIQTLKLPFDAVDGGMYHWSMTSAGSKVFALTDTNSLSPQFIAIPGEYSFELKFAKGSEARTYTLNTVVKDSANRIRRWTPPKDAPRISKNISVGKTTRAIPAIR